MFVVCVAMVEQGVGLSCCWLGLARLACFHVGLQPSTRCKTSFHTSFRLSNSHAFVIDSKYPGQAEFAIVGCELLQDRTDRDN